ncbi:MAG: hypothetical protein Greene071436_193, partial [Parcubacteria group bacterium Greene0714_36]
KNVFLDMPKKPKYIAKAGTMWTKKEVATMKKLGGRTPTRVIGLKLQRPAGGIKKKARTIGMTLKPVNKFPRTTLKG